MPLPPPAGPAPELSTGPLRHTPGCQDCRVSARRRPQFSSAALAWLEPRPLVPVVDHLSARELELLRCRGLDERLCVQVLGRLVPRDLLSGPGGRACHLLPHLPAGATVYGASALWVHTGERPPQVLEAVWPGHTGRGRRLRVHQGRLPQSDTVQLGEVACCTLARAAVDVARLEPPSAAVAALLAAQAAGVEATELYNCASHCVGAQVRGRDRVERLVRALYG